MYIIFAEGHKIRFAELTIIINHIENPFNKITGCLYVFFFMFVPKDLANR